MNTILIIAFCAMGFMLPAMFCAGFYYGFNTAEGVFTQQAVARENIPGYAAVEKVKEAFRPPETAEQRKQRIMGENIENYGTSIPQQEVK